MKLGFLKGALEGLTCCLLIDLTNEKDDRKNQLNCICDSSPVQVFLFLKRLRGRLITLRFVDILHYKRLINFSTAHLKTILFYVNKNTYKNI